MRRVLLLAAMASCGCGATVAGEQAMGQAARLLRQHQPGDQLRAGEALWRAGFKSCAIQRFARGLMAGGQLGRRAALRLAEDSELPLDDEAFRGLRQQDLARVPRRARRSLSLRLARRLLRQGQLDAARAVLRRAPGPRALYLLALSELAAQRWDQAGQLLQRCRQRAAAKDSGLTSAAAAGLRELATLALARLQAQRSRAGRARCLYRSIPAVSPHFFSARQELTWLLLQLYRPREALAVSHDLAAPRFAIKAWPDRELVRAMALSQLGQPGAARALSRRSLQRTALAIKRTVKFLRPRGDDRLYYVEAMASAVRRKNELPADVLATLLADSGFRREFRIVRQIQRERTLLLGTGAAALRNALSRELDQRLIRAQSASGRRTRVTVARALAELRELHQRAQELLVDLERTQPRRDLRDSKGRARVRSAAGSPCPADTQGRQRWPFHREYWADEVGHYQLAP